MKKHDIVQLLVDNEAEEQGYTIEERDAFMAGIDAWVIWHKHNNYVKIDKSTFGTLQMIKKYFGKNDKTPFEHLAFEVIDRIIKSNTP